MLRSIRKICVKAYIEIYTFMYNNDIYISMEIVMYDSVLHLFSFQTPIFNNTNL